MKATHIKSGHTGEIQNVMYNDDGAAQFYFEDHVRPTAAGWYRPDELLIPHRSRCCGETLSRPTREAGPWWYCNNCGKRQTEDC